MRQVERVQRVGTSLGFFASVALHFLGYAFLQWAGALPQVEFELTLPNEVEFGVTEGAAAEPLPEAVEPEASAADPDPVGSQEPPAVEDEGPEPEPDIADAGTPPDAASKDAGTERDAAIADAGPPRDAAPPHDAGKPTADAGRPSDAGKGAPADAGRPLLSAYAPPGAQIALRLDIGRIRASALADDVRSLLGAIPDWKAILDGSGIQPLEQLERIFIASPNLRRSSIVVAGQYEGGADIARAAVASLAQERGREAKWSKHGAIEVAPWHNKDSTERIIALIAAQQFVIARPDDLPRVIAAARALAARSRKNRTKESTDKEAADALLALGEGQMLGLSVEGARQFARGNLRSIPERLESAVRQTEDGLFEVTVEGTFENEAGAKVALDYWEGMRRRLQGHPLVALFGMSRPVARAVLEVDEASLRVRTTVTLTQARFVLNTLRNALTPVEAPPLAPRPGTPIGPGTPSTAPPSNPAALPAKKPAEKPRPRPGAR